MQFGFSVVEDVLAARHAIRSDARSAFASRLKHLQRLGFPPGVNTGRGKAASYDAGHLWQLGLALELMQLGLTPERVISALLKSRASVIAGLYETLNSTADANRGPVIFWLMPTYLSELSDPALGELQMMMSFDRLQDFVRKDLSAGHTAPFRVSLFNGSDVLSAITRGLARVLDAPRDEILAQLEHWAGSMLDRFDADDPQA